MKDSLPEICQDCPENSTCNQDPEMWKCMSPNMDEVVRQVKEELDEATEGQWVSDGFGSITIKDSGRIITSVYAPEDFQIVAKGPEWLRLLIEEREQLILAANDWEDEYMKLKREFEELDKSALETIDLLNESGALKAEQDKEIQQVTIDKERLALIIDRMADFYGCDLNEWLKDQN